MQNVGSDFSLDLNAEVFYIRNKQLY